MDFFTQKNIQHPFYIFGYLYGRHPCSLVVSFIIKQFYKYFKFSKKCEVEVFLYVYIQFIYFIFKIFNYYGYSLHIPKRQQPQTGATTTLMYRLRNDFSALHGFEGPTQSDSLRVCPRIQEAPKEPFLLPQIRAFSNLRDLYKSEKYPLLGIFRFC